jgi:hexosaminidase
MVWAYGHDVSDYIGSGVYAAYGRVFGTVWAASAYKGASGELQVLTDIRGRYLNHLAWVEEVLQREGLVHFRGIALTGWSR